MLMRKGKIKLRNFLMMLSNGITSILIFTFFILMYKTTSGCINEVTESINRSEFEYIVSSIERNYNEAVNISKCIGNNEKLKRLISVYLNENIAIDDRKDALNNAVGVLTHLKSYAKSIKSINIISGSKRIYTHDYLISLDTARQIANERIEGINFYYPSDFEHDDSIAADGYLIKDLKHEIYIKSPITDKNNLYCSLYIFLNNSFFSEAVSSKKDVIIYDTNNILYSSFENNDKLTNGNFLQKLKAREKSGDSFIYNKTLDNGWTVAYLPDKNSFTLRKQPLNEIMLLSFIISLVCSLFLSNYLSKSVLRPVNSIIEFMLDYSYGRGKCKKYNTDTSKRKVSLREKIFYYLILTIMPPVLIFVVLFYFQANSLAKRHISDQYMNTFDKTAKYVERYFDNKAEVFKSIVYDSAVQEYIFEVNEGNINEIIEILRNYKYLGLERNELSIYNSSNLVFSSHLNAVGNIDDNNISFLNDLKHGFSWGSCRDELSENVFLLMTKIIPISKQNISIDKQVYAALKVPFKEVYNIYGNMHTNTSDVYISDCFGKNIFNESSKKLFIKELTKYSGKLETGNEGQRYIAFYHKISKTPWYLVAKYSYQDMSRKSSEVLANNIYIIIIVLMSIIVLSHFISLLLLKPVNIFNNVLETYYLDDVDIDMMEDSFIDEIDSLGINFNKMIERIEDLFDDLLIANKEKNQLKLQMKAAEMVALQAQINPHFLYNTLNNLIYLIDNGYKEKAHQVVSSLSRLFRFGISRGDRIIAIGEEIAYAKAYAEIISIRYGDGISFMWVIDESLAEYKTLKLILQPLIENAVFHGFKNMNKGCIICIKCFEQDDTIKFVVSDNGEGISEDKIEVIKREIHSDNVEDRIGIFNVQARIQLQYGREYGLDIQSVKLGGTIVTITIPKDEEGIE